LFEAATQYLLKTRASAKSLKSELEMASPRIVETRQDLGMITQVAEALVEREDRSLGCTYMRSQRQFLRMGSVDRSTGGSKASPHLSGYSIRLRKKRVSTNRS
jgi:hypothetical protein